MSENELPEFAKRKLFQVLPYANKIFMAQHDGRNHLVRVIPYPAGHFRAIFSADYFVSQSEDGMPSRSQWNTLKKKFKRHNRQVFVFKQSGEIDCQSKNDVHSTTLDSPKCLYIDFGFYQE